MVAYGSEEYKVVLSKPNQLFPSELERPDSTRSVQSKKAQQVIISQLPIIYPRVKPSVQDSWVCGIWMEKYLRSGTVDASKRGILFPELGFPASFWMCVAGMAAGLLTDSNR